MPKDELNDMHETLPCLLLAVESLKVWYSHIGAVESVAKLSLLFYVRSPTVYLDELSQKQIVKLLLPFLHFFLIAQELNVLLDIGILLCFGVSILVCQVVQL